MNDDQDRSTLRRDEPEGFVIYEHGQYYDDIIIICFPIEYMTYIKTFGNGKERQMNELNDKIYDAVLTIVSCSQSQRYIIKDLYEMEADANMHGGKYRGLSNIIDVMSETIETQIFKIFEAMGV